MNSAMLSFSLTPVQDFVEAARTVRDLKAGSWLLSHLTYQAFDRARTLEGTAVFPTPPPSGQGPGSIPNQFVMRFDSVEDASNAEEECRNAVQARWKEIAATVHAALKPGFDAAFTGWDCDWDAQIERYWDIISVVVPLADMTPETYEALFGAAPTGGIGLAEQWKIMQMLFAAKKHVRHFPGNHGTKRHKCALLGRLEQMGPIGLRDADRFWSTEGVAGFSREGIYLGERDRLCAVSLVKRFSGLDAGLSSLQEPVMDTAGIATSAWWAQVKGQLPQETAAFEEAVESLQSELGGGRDTEMRYLVMDNISVEALARGTHFERTPEAIREQAANLDAARSSLFSRARESDMSAPPRYYAILSLDGDEVGKWLGGDKTPLTEGYHSAVSIQLLDFAGQAEDIVNEHRGVLVYAGGDDVLALLPAANVLACARELRESYPQFATNTGDSGPASTASAGICILHYMQDLRTGLQAARQACDQAKDWGRDALGVTVMKSSGSSMSTTVEWPEIAHMARLQQLFEAGVSDRWVYKLWGTVPDVSDSLLPDAVGLMVSHATRRMEVSGPVAAEINRLLAQTGDAKENLRGYIQELWVRLTDTIHQRHLQLAKQRHLRPEDLAAFPSKSGKCFAQKVLDEFCKYCLIMSFLTRGRD
ncbi:MAG: type III-B CRISPR-associated protein Cas10/Cmr2 [candidate division WS1 bacterium]|jgi:CRISPR-associated protein Cmr2|nr:type III-B CRISPR-associated protein Cas10/Cmr2 [candidate division WS1 bacterium]